MRFTISRIFAVPIGAFALGFVLSAAAALYVQPTTLCGIFQAERQAQMSTLGQRWTIEVADQKGRAISNRSASQGEVGRLDNLKPLLYLRGRVVLSLILAGLPLTLFAWLMGTARSTERHNNAEGPSSIRSQFGLSSVQVSMFGLGAVVAVPFMIPTMVLSIILFAGFLTGIYVMRSYAPVVI